jgi:monoterpene epsilon-lactone hydrolase
MSASSPPSRAGARPADGRRGTPAPPELVARRDAAAAALSGLPLAERVTATPDTVGGVPVLVLSPTDPGPATLLYLHGGGYRLGSAATFRSYASHLADAVGGRVVSVDYRLAPENPYPAALDDVVAVYTGLLAEIGPGRLVVGGDSAGGGLAAALGGRLAAAGLPHPAATVLISPWVDLRLDAESLRSNGPTDALFSLEAATEAGAQYRAGHPATDPLVSPVLDDWSGRPPLLVHCSGAEVLRDDSRLLAEVARAAGVDVRLEEYPDVPHVWHLAAPTGSAEALRALADIGSFVRAAAGPAPDDARVG